MSSTGDDATDPPHFRDVLGCYPTSVCVVTSEIAAARHGLVVGAVEELDKWDQGSPLLFFGGHYHGLHELDLA